MLVQTLYIYVMYGCLPASFQHPYSILCPSSILTPSSQPPPSISTASIINRFWHTGALTIYMFLYICALAINHVWYIYMCVHSPFIFFDNIYALVINLYGWFVTHTCTVFFLFCLPRTHVGALSADTKDVYPVCIALHMHIMPYDRLVFVELHIHN